VTGDGVLMKPIGAKFAWTSRKKTVQSLAYIEQKIPALQQTAIEGSVKTYSRFLGISGHETK